MVRTKSLREKALKRRSTKSSPLVHVQQQQSEVGSISSQNGIDPEEVRLASLDMLKKALIYSDIPNEATKAERLAKSVEMKLFEEHKGVSVQYKAAVRRLVFNLRRNQDLRHNVLTGSIKPENFAVMTSQDMASEEMRKLRERFVQEGIRENQLADEEGTPTEMFKCGKCHGHNCTYRQAQTRSADEPMTTFVYCRGCGNRWKFS